MSQHFSPTVRSAIDRNNTRNGGHVSPTAITLPPFMVQALIKGTDDMAAEARKLEQKRLKDMARPWKPRPLIVDSRQAKPETNVGTYLAIAIFTAWASARLLGWL